MILGGAGKAASAGWVLMGVGGVLSFFFLVVGMLGLHHALNPKPAGVKLDTDPRLEAALERPALPPQPVSVTEGTTSLINSPEQVSIGARDTGSVD
jgi:hypothetical protein